LKKSTLRTKQRNEVIVHITAQYVEQVQAGRRPLLSDYLVRYPAYTDALADFVAYYHAFEEHIWQKLDGSEALSEISQLALERAWCHVSQSEDKRSGQLPTLLVKRDNLCLSFSSLAQELDLSVDIVVQLEQCRIDPASIPLELAWRMASAIQQPLYVIQAYLANSQQQASGKSAGTQQRVAEQQETYSSVSVRADTRSFRQALIASDQLSDRQRESWCRIIEHENMEWERYD
jgi:hypothetical protein